MANLKIRGLRDSIEDKGPQDGPKQSMTVGETSIPDTVHAGTGTPTRSSGPRTQPNSSLGATRVKRYNGGIKA